MKNDGDDWEQARVGDTKCRVKMLAKVVVNKKCGDKKNKQYLPQQD